jgi:predicted permease
VDPSGFGRRLMMLLRRRRFDRDLADEMQLHLDLRAAREVERGAPPREAARLARRAFGGALGVREQSRDAWGWRWLDEMGRAFRQAVRMLRRRPVFAASAVTTLAIAIGANVAIFGLIDRVVLRPIDVPDPLGLVTIQRTFEARGVRRESTSMTWENAQRVRGMSTLEGVAVSSSSLDRASKRLAVSVDGHDPADPVDGRFISANYFHVLGLRPALGRDFEADDDLPGAPPAVILSHRLWRLRFGADGATIGRTIRINGVPAVVIGVASRTFTGTELGAAPPDLFLPLMTGQRLATSTGSQTDGRGRFFSGDVARGERSAISPIADLTIIGRVRPHGENQAQAELTSLFGSPAWTVVPLAETMLPFDARTDLRRFLGLLAAAVGLTLLIGCANLASLLLARAEERRMELAIRAALGAGRGRLVQELAVEAGVLAMVGGTAALLVAWWIDRGLSAFVLPGGIAVSSLRSGANLRTLVFAMCATAVAAMVIAIAPTGRAVSGELGLHIKRSGGGSPRFGVTRVLVAVQVTVCVLLVFGAALFVRSLANALATDLGFDAHGLVSASVSLPSTRTVDGLSATDGLVERVRTLPGISAVSAGPLPLVRGSDRAQNEIRADGVPLDLSEPVDVVYTAAEYFTTLRQPLVRGRDFDARDRTGARPVAIVNEAAARQFWPDHDALDRRLGLPSRVSATAGEDFAVVGIVRDVKLKNLRETGRPVVYLARLQHQVYLAGYLAGSGSSFLIVRASGNPAVVSQSLVRVAADAGLSVQAVTTLDRAVNEILMPQRLGRALLMLLGLMALTLTVVGIYGLVSCLVARTMKESGIRIALGANARDIIGPLLSRVVLPVTAGAVIGAVLAWSGGRFADRFMYGMHGSDPTTIAIALATIVGSGVVAALLPTRRALRLNPIETLRTD